MNTVTRILIVEDLAADYELAQRELRKAVQNCHFRRVQNERDFLQALDDFQPDLIISDYRLPGFDGMKAVELTQQHSKLIPIIIWTGTMSEDMAVTCMKKGAANYIFKDNLKRLGPAVVHALEERKQLLERRQTDARIQELLDFNARIINNSPVGIATYKVTGECVFISENAAFMLGATVDELKTRNFRTIESWRKSGLYDLVQEAIAAHTAVTSDVHMISPSGRDIWVTAHCMAFRSGREDLVLLSLSDITESRLAAERLAKHEEVLRLFVEHSPAAVAMLDRDMKYIVASRRYLTYYQLGEQDVAGRSHYDVFPDVSERWRQIHRRCLAGAVEKSDEDAFARMDGNVEWVRWEMRPWYESSSEIGGIIIFSEVITQRKRAEAERHALFEIMQGMAKSDDLQEFLKLTHGAIAKVIHAENLFVILHQSESGLFEEIYTVDQYDPPAPPSRLEKSITSYVFHSGEPLLLTAERFNELVARGDCELVGTPAQSWLGIPLKTSEETIGVLAVQDYEKADRYSEHDKDFLASIASQVALAIERKQAQEALWASETHYRELADSITDVLFEMDDNKRYTHWNKASEVLTGIPAEDAIGRSLDEIFGTSGEQRHIAKIYEDVLKNRQAKTFETDLSVEGQQRTFEVNVYPSRRGVAVVAKNVTERRLWETLLQKRFELMEYSAHHSLDEVMQKTIDELSSLTGSHIGFMHFVEADEVTLSLQTWSAETLRDFCRAEGKGLHYPVEQAGVWADAVRQGRSLIHNDYESVIGKKGMPEGHPGVLREMVIPVIRDEKVVAVMGVGNKPQPYTEQDLEIGRRFADYAWDTTERKKMESAIDDERNQLAKRVEERTADLSRANSNLARALLVKDEFLANMSHELRTPLNAILGLSESLAEQAAGPLNEKQQRYLTTINESGHHLLSLINDILDLAKIEAGRITLDINKVDVNSVCQSSLRMIKQLAQKKNQEVFLEIDSSLGWIRADERRLKQMIVNLLGNAVKFTPEAGKIGLDVHGDQAANKVVFTVWDNGIGISKSDMERLFRPFVQLDSGLAREATGTGLGLALVAQMARLHGGGVQLTSQPGEGSRFSIQLPWKPLEARDAGTRPGRSREVQTAHPNGGNKPTILLIDDTREVVMTLTNYLEPAGYKIVTAQDGLDGLIQAKLTRPDIILMDIQMSRLDGFETTWKLKNDPEFKAIPIIALTALAMPHDHERCLAAGMDEYMSKPVDLKHLAKTLQKFIPRHKEVHP